MRIVEKIRDIQRMSLYVDGNFNVAYSYDSGGRIIEERVTGSVNRVINYEYDEKDNLIKEIYNDTIKTITKVYTYDEVSGNVTSIQGTTTDSI